MDWRMPEDVRQRAAAYPQRELEVGYFSSRSLRERIGHVDAVVLFDVLLHRVDPDWDEVLAAWSGVADYPLVANPRWLRDHTTRLLDMGEDEYVRNVPHERDEPPYDDLFAKLECAHSVHGRR